LDERLVVQREPAVIPEGTAAGDRGRIVELGVDDDFGSTAAPESATAVPEQPAIEELAPGSAEGGAPAPVVETAPPAAAQPAEGGGPVFAQVLSSSEAKPAENLAAKLIEAGFTSAYVERVPTGTAGAMIYRVRVRFPNEQQARASVDRLKGLSGGGDVWITKQ
ncbi:MAG TPA: SPOR domain-containing protein, partial [Thermoanaerobaculia bacterium]|nr:SPOR domain-containing protein [Thermoanaerobaculia bacterium]